METREKILLGAFDLFMKYGVKSVTMDDIAQTLGVSKKTIYQFIGNKKVLIETVILNFLESDEAAIIRIINEAENAIDEMFALSKHVNSFLSRMRPTFMYDLQKYYRTEWELIRKKHFAFIHEVIKKNIEQGKTQDLYRADIDPEIISRFYTRASESAIDENLFPSSEYPKTTLFLEHLTYHMFGLVNNNGQKLLLKKNLKMESNA
jgi:AcrR family transcriptional regulator